MKDKKKCLTCAYAMNGYSNSTMKTCCDYLEVTGTSRIVKEMADGSYKSRECTSYTPKQGRKLSPWQR